MATTTLIAAPRSARSPLVRWHLLSLDAPTVAAAWTTFLSRCFGIHLTWAAALALPLAVWIFYAADRLMDARGTGALQARHHFHAQHRGGFMHGMAVAVVSLGICLALLPPPVRTGWLMLSLPLAAYAAAVHGRRPSAVPKEALVAVFFAVAVSVPAWTLQPKHGAALAGASALFGAVCWLNCVAIARWEGGCDRTVVWAARHFPAVAVAVCAVSLLLALEGRWRIALAAAVSTCLLLLLDSARGSMDRLQLRSLADAALLSPLLLWPLLPR